jgi:hypothetical protein
MGRGTLSIHVRHRYRRVGAQIVALAMAATGGILALPPSLAHAAGTTIGVTLTTSDLSSALTPQPSVSLGAVSSGPVSLTVDDTKSYQTIDGFGAAFMDSSTYLLQNKLSATAVNCVADGVDPVFLRAVKGGRLDGVEEYGLLVCGQRRSSRWVEILSPGEGVIIIPQRVSSASSSAGSHRPCNSTAGPLSRSRLPGRWRPGRAPTAQR